MANNELNKHFARNHAYLIAVQDYRHVTALKTPVNDVERVAKALQLPIHGFGVTLLLNPDKTGLSHFFEQTLQNEVKEGDRILLYFAGHGIAMDEVNQTVPKGYLLPSDATREDEASYISMDFVNEQLQKLRCRHLLLVLDCCFAGSFQWAAQQQTRSAGRSQLSKNIYRQRFDFFLEKSAWQVVASASFHQKALDHTKDYSLGHREDSEHDHSPFAAAMVNILENGLDYHNGAKGLMPISNVFAFLQNELAGLSHVHTQKPAFFTLPNHKQGEFLFLDPKVILHLVDYVEANNPYRGLESYEQKHQNTFYGRERVVNDLMAVFKKDVPLMVISGDSGTGKSSVVKAGFLPTLEQKGFFAISIRPGSNPVQALEAALDESNAHLSQQIVLFIDQLEEVATYNAPKSEREEFIARMSELLEQRKPFKTIIVTVRSDFEMIFTESLLSLYWKDARYSIPGFEYEELQYVITQPMWERCIDYEEGLAETLVKEVQNRVGSLPLLSFTLSELYERFKIKQAAQNSGRLITWEDYDQTGGVVGSLQKGADQAYDDLPDDAHRTSLRHLMLRLTSLSGTEVAGRRALYEELEFEDQAENERVAFVRDEWIKRRLFRSGTDSEGKNFVEPAHDALVRSWKRMQGWLQDSKGEDVLMLAKIGGAIRDYRKHDKSKEYLWHKDPNLGSAVIILTNYPLLLNGVERTFIERSMAEKTRIAKRNWIIATVIGALIITAAIIAIWQARIAGEKERVAQKNLSQKKEQERAKEALNIDKFMADAKIFIRSGDYDLAIQKYFRADTTMNNFSNRLFSSQRDSVNNRVKFCFKRITPHQYKNLPHFITLHFNRQ